MTAIGITTIALGVLLVGSRAPLLFAPAATLGWVDWLVETNARIRRLGAIALTLGALMTWAGSTGEGALATVLTVWGWGVVGMALLTLVLFPDLYRGLVGAILPGSVSQGLPGWRLLGLLGTGIGVLLIYVGVRAL